MDDFRQRVGRLASHLLAAIRCNASERRPRPLLLRQILVVLETEDVSQQQSRIIVVDQRRPGFRAQSDAEAKPGCPLGSGFQLVTGIAQEGAIRLRIC